MKNVLVIGDVMLDEWVYGSVNRISPEAPIPILDVDNSVKCLGGAGNVYSNLNELGCNASIICGIGVDKTGGEILRLLGYNLNSLCFEIPISFKKQRICSGQQQIVRIDEGYMGYLKIDIRLKSYFDALKYSKYEVDVVLVSDYGKGIITPNSLFKIEEFCRNNKIPLLIDPYIQNKHSYTINSDLIKLNKSEAEFFSGIKINHDENLKMCGDALMKYFPTKSVLITMGEGGMAYFDKDKYSKEPYKVVDNPSTVFDVSGAGDVVFATVGCLMASGEYEIEEIINYAAKAGRLAVSKKGTSVITKEELFE